MSSDIENNNPENNLVCGDSKKRAQNKRLVNKKKWMKYEVLYKGYVHCDRIPRQMREPSTLKFCLKCSVLHCAIFTEDDDVRIEKVLRNKPYWMIK